MKAMEVEILEGRNSALVDLFDPLHARKVLAGFGRAYGRLPDNLDQCTKEQDAFLDQAVAELAQDGKVISVRLALFAEMVKGKPWTPARLREMGGTEGVGVMFLEETFTACTAPPLHRVHHKAAQAVLNALLPEAGSDIKGHMQSQQDLLTASGYATRPEDFDELLRILDSEIRLITPTDPAGVDRGEGRAAAEEKSSDQRSPLASRPAPLAIRYYQLTHDYLVPSLRDWLTRKQKETRRGRAELLLADRAAVWHARPENRQLPSLPQWLGIRVWTHRQTWTPQQQRMMRRATRYHAVRGAVLAVFLAAAALAGLAFHEHNQRAHAAGLVQTLVNANIAQVPDIVSEIDAYRAWADPLLRQELARATEDSAAKLHASLALMPVDPGQVDYVYRRLLEAEPHEVGVLRDALEKHKEAVTEKLWTVAAQPGASAQRLRAATALARYDPHSPRWADVQQTIADDVVRVPAVYLAAWMEGLRPVKRKLVAPLAVVFGNPQRRETERSLAADLLAEYANDDPEQLADLLMAGDAKQFAVLFAKLQLAAERGRPILETELRKRIVTQTRTLLKVEGGLTVNEPRVKIVGFNEASELPAKPFPLEVRAGRMYTLTMDSAAMDSVLVLQDSAGKQLAYDDDSGGNLNSKLVYFAAKDDTCQVYAATLKGAGAFVLQAVESDAAEDAKEILAKRQANAAVALLRLGEANKVWPLLRHRRDPRLRSYVIHRLAPLGASPEPILAQLSREPDSSIRRALVLSLGGFDFGPARKQALTTELLETYREHPDPGLHAAAEWLLRQWKQERQLAGIDQAAAQDRDAQLERIRQKLVNGSKTPEWYVNGQGQTLVVIPGPVEFELGTPATEAGRAGGPKDPTEMLHKKRIGRSFTIAAKEVTLAEFRKFRPEHRYYEQYAPTEDCPVSNLSWYDAVAYCNWLSKEEGIPEKEWCYEGNAQGNFAEGMKVRRNYLQRTGYRLPTEAEWEYACRGGAMTSRYYGESEELLGKYAWYTTNSLNRWLLPGGSLKPNDLGLFDMLGNALEWCHDPVLLYASGDDKEFAMDEKDVSNTSSRAVRGGSFYNLAVVVRCGLRYKYAPADHFFNVGFRPARTFR